MIAIDNISFVKIKRTPKTSKRATKIMQRYKDAYMQVYGVLPEITFDGTYYRIKGHGSGVKLSRLKEMARQLEYRSGQRED